MGAKFNTQDKHWLLAIAPKNYKMTSVEAELMNTMFETETDYDERQTNKEIFEYAHWRQYCFLKLIMFPIELPFFILTFRFNYLMNKLKLPRLYFNLVFKRITFTEFKTKWNEVCKNAIII